MQPNRGHERENTRMTGHRYNAGVVAPPPLIYGGPSLLGLLLNRKFESRSCRAGRRASSAGRSSTGCCSWAGSSGRPLVLFGSPAAERSQDPGAASERTLQRETRSFGAEGISATLREAPGMSWLAMRKRGGRVTRPPPDLPLLVAGRALCRFRAPEAGSNPSLAARPS